MRTDVDARDGTRGLSGHRTGVCTGSWEKNERLRDRLRYIEVTNPSLDERG